MDTFFKMAQTQSVLFLYILLGIACRKRGLFDDHTRGKLTDFTLMVTLPCMVFDSFHMPFDLAALYRGGLALAIAFVMVWPMTSFSPYEALCNSWPINYPW